VEYSVIAFVIISSKTRDYIARWEWKYG